MRLSLPALFLYLVTVGAAHAEVFTIASADTKISRVIAKLVEEAYQHLDIDVEVVYRPAARSFREVNSGKFDAELVRTTGLEIEFPNVVRVREPVFRIGISAIVRSDSDIKISSWEDLAGLSVGYPRGYRLLDVRTRNLNAIKANDAHTIFRMVNGGRMDVGLLLTSNAMALAKEFIGISVLQPPIEEIPLFHYVHIKHRRLVPELENVLIEMNDSGRSNEILFTK